MRHTRQIELEPRIFEYIVTECDMFTGGMYQVCMYLVRRGFCVSHDYVIAIHSPLDIYDILGEKGLYRDLKQNTSNSI